MKYNILNLFIIIYFSFSAGAQDSFIDTIYFDDAGIDAQVFQGSTNTNYGSDTICKAFYDYGPPNYSYWSYYQIDLTAIPDNAIVLNSSLNLYAQSILNPSAQSVLVDRVTSNWYEDSIKWSLLPSVLASGSGRITIPKSETDETGWHQLPITSHVQYSIANPSLNYGWRVALAATGTSDYGFTYLSSEYSDQDFRPYVIVEYRIPLSDTIYIDADGYDSFVSSGLTSTNFGTDTSLIVKWEYDTAGVAYRSLLRADLSGVPRDAIVTKANLHLYAEEVDNTGDHAMFVSTVTTTWTENGVNWTNQPSITNANRILFTDAASSDTGWHVMNVKNTTQVMVTGPEKNYGWRINLQTESDTLNKGVVYASSNDPDSSRRPFIIVEYHYPIFIDAYVTHCTNGNDDGSITNVTATGGCGSYVSYGLYKLASGVLTLIEAGTNLSTSDVSGLSDGLYLFRITDYTGIIGYKYFFVGEEGVTTNVEFDITHTGNRATYGEDSFLTYYKTSGDSSTVGAYSTAIACATTSSYNSRSLIQYYADWDPTLEYFSVKQCLYAFTGCTQYANSDNDAYISRVTEYWYEKWVNWALRPNISTEDQIYIPTTTTNGTELRYDTIQILPFVEYWQQHPSENFGFEMSLVTYNQPQTASRIYGSTDYTPRNLMVSFTVKPKIETVFYDSLGTGDITVNAPAGELPYTYLIGTDSLPELTEIWNFIKDSTNMDSTFLFQGKTNSRNYVYSGLTAGDYFVGVYDNSGIKIFEQKTTLSPDLIAYYSVGIYESAEYVKVDSSDTSGLVTFLAQLPQDDSGGFSFTVDSLNGTVIVGLNKLNDTIPFLDRFFEYAIHYDSTGRFEIRKSGSLLTGGSVSIGDEFKMIKEYDTIYVYKNSLLQYKDPYNYADGDYKLEASLKGPEAFLAKPLLIASFLKPKYIKWTVVLPECAEDEGSITISLPSSHFKYQYVNFYITNLQTNEIEYSGTSGGTFNLPIGYYSLTWNVYQYIGGVYVISPYSGVSEFIIGYPVVWDFVTPDDNITQLSGTNTITPTNPSQWGYATSQSMTPSAADFWYGFNVSRKISSPTYHSVNIVLLNNLGVASTLIIQPYLYPGVVTRWVKLNGSSWASVNNTNSFVIQSESAGFTVRNQGDIILPTSGIPAPNPISGSLSIDVSEIGKVYLSNNYVSFCSPDIETVYFTPYKTIQGGFYLVPTDDILRFEFFEEYTLSGDLNFAVKDYQNTSISGLSVINEVFGDNRIDLDVSSLLPGFYILEIKNDKNETWYLRFKVQ